MLRIAAVTNINQWSAQNYLDELKTGSSVMRGVIGDSGLLGFIVGRIVAGIGEGSIDAEIYNLAIDPAHQRKGLGHMLFSHFLSSCREATVENIWLEVRESNTGAIDFYQRHEFQSVQKRINFYEDPRENALLMCRKLKG